MLRIYIGERPDWRGIVEGQGLVYNTTPAGPYWHEKHCYELTGSDVDRLESATNLLHCMCMEAGQFIIDNDRFADFGIPEHAVEAIKSSWIEEPPSLYGRFDLALNRDGAIKLLEYNADTPTGLLEAAAIQWHWLTDKYPTRDQFNSIHDRLVDKWKELERYLIGSPVYFACMESPDGEDLMTTSYLRETAGQAGLWTQSILMRDIGWNGSTFVDLSENNIRSIFKLYPWEWMVHEEFGQNALQNYSNVQWVEPIWKMMLSNKALLAVLWEMYPNHENLLGAYIEGHDQYGTGRRVESGMGPYKEFVRKPLLSREGANVQIASRYGKTEKDGDYGEEGHVIQEFCDSVEFEGVRPVIGSWVVNGLSAGIGIRENDGLITDNLSRFVPHLF